MTGHETRLSAADGGSFGAYLAMPSKLPAPGIVVLQEIFGVNGFIREVADGLAAQGYIAIAPDLFWRQTPGVQLDSDAEADRGKAFGLYQGLDEKKAVQDSIAALNALRGMKECSGRVGALGYCLGGKLAYLMAARSSVDAAVGYYGVGINGALDEAAQIRVPVLLHVAGSDHFCPPEAQRQLVEAFSSRTDTVTVVIHEGVDHAFARTGSGAFRAEAAARADQSTREFLKRHLLAAKGE